VIVLDASALSELLLRTDRAEWVARQLRTPLAIPDLCPLEVMSVVRRKERHGELDARRATVALDDLLAFPAAVHATRALLPRVFELRHALSMYDAAYVALAEALDAPLLTLDGRLARATGHRAAVRAPAGI
jgi:predicted nucleic acid-binding protein